MMFINQKEINYLAYLIEREIQILENLEFQDIDPYLYVLRDKLKEKVS